MVGWFLQPRATAGLQAQRDRGLDFSRIGFCQASVRRRESGPRITVDRRRFVCTRRKIGVGQSSGSFLEVGVAERLALECVKNHFPAMQSMLCNNYTKGTRLTCETNSLLLLLTVTHSPLSQLCSLVATNPQF